MVIINTTFHVHRTVKSEFNLWIRNVYIKAATTTGLLTNPLLTRIIEGEDPEGTDYALHLSAPSLREAARWHDDTAVLLRNDMTARFGERVLFFTTYLEVMDLD